MTDNPNLQETVLLVEDEVLVRMPIAQYLRDCGYKVIEAGNADEAMAVLLHKETVVDIVFSDIEKARRSRWVRAGEVDQRASSGTGRFVGGNRAPRYPECERIVRAR